MLRRQIKQLRHKTKLLIQKQANIYSKLNDLSNDFYFSHVTSNNNKFKNNNNSDNNFKGGKKRESDIVFTYLPTSNIGSNATSSSDNTIETDENDNSTANASTQSIESEFKINTKVIDEKLKTAIATYKSCIIGDFFIGTCWRLQVVTCTTVITAVAAYVEDVCVFNLFSF